MQLGQGQRARGPIKAIHDRSTSARLKPKSKNKQRVPCTYSHILLSFNAIRYGSGRNLSAKPSSPEEASISGVKNEEVAFAIRRKQRVRRSRKDTRVGHVVHSKGPNLFARHGIDRFYLTVSNGVRPSIDRPANNIRQGRSRKSW